MFDPALRGLEAVWRLRIGLVLVVSKEREIACRKAV